MAAVACMKSGMVTITASMLLPFSSSILRKSLYFGAFSYCLNFCAARLLVHIAQSDDVFGRAAIDVARSLAACADRGDVQFLVRRFVAQRLQRRNAAEAANWNCARQKRADKKMSSRAVSYAM